MPRWVFGVVVLSVLILLFAYMRWRLIDPLPWSDSSKRIASWSFFVIVALMPISRMISSTGPLASGLQWISYILMGALALLLSLLVLRDAVWLILHGLDLFMKKVTPSPPNLLPPDPERRAALTSMLNLGLLSTATGMSAYGFVQARLKTNVVRVSVPVHNLPKGLEGFKIAQISDIHVGPTIHRPFVERVVKIVNSLDADLIAMTGDLVDGFVPQLRSHVEPFKELRATHGSFYVTGNHEYYWDAPGWITEAERVGFKPLVNEHTVIQHRGSSIAVAGVTDYSAHRILPEHTSDPKKALQGAPQDAFKLLLAHQPKSIYKAAQAGADLQLSGHTHGGQFYPWNFIVGLAHPFSKGLHTFRDTLIYVSRGTGYWGPPMRIGAPAEITLLTLTRA